MIFRRQAAVLLFIGLVTFKISKLFSMINQKVGGDAWLLALCYVVVECAIFFAAYYYTNSDADKKLSDGKLKPLYYSILAVLAVFLLLKSVLYFCETATFCEKYLFDQIPSAALAIMLMSVVFYMLTLGISGLSRTAEMVFMVVVAVFVTNLVFVKTNFDISRNLPILAFGFKDFAVNGFDFWFWTGDLLPLFLLKFADKKKGAMTVSLISGAVSVVAVYLMTVGIYDAISVYVDAPLVSIAAYSRFAKVLGGLELFGIMAWLIMAILQIAFLLWGASEILVKFGLKRVPSSAIVVAPALLTVIFVPVLSAVMGLAVTQLKYIALGAIAALPIALLVLGGVANGKAKTMEENAND